MWHLHLSQKHRHVIEHTTYKVGFSLFTNCSLLQIFLLFGNTIRFHMFFFQWLSEALPTKPTKSILEELLSLLGKYTLIHYAQRPDIQYSMCVGWLATMCFLSMLNCPDLFQQLQMIKISQFVYNIFCNFPLEID